MKADTQTYDAIVVGSGITGGWAAKELTEGGLKTLLLERGRPVEHGFDYVGEHVAPWELPFRGQGDRRLYEKQYPVQSQCYAFGEDTRHFFVNDSENPYANDEDKPYSWIRGYQLGGRSIMWARHSYRWSDLDFEANARDGFGVDWPIRYADLAPWYDHVESFAGISGQAEGIPQLPDGKFLPPMEMNCVERAAREKIVSAFPDRLMTIGRVAVLTKPLGGREACHYCGPCHRGCSTGSYFCSLSSTLPAAQATGNLTVRTHSIVHGVVFDEETDRATGVRIVDAVSKKPLEFRAKLVFLCASTLGSTHILLNSKTARFPTGLGNSSGALGHYLMDHTYAAGATAEMPGFEDRYYSGYRPNGVYLPRFRNVRGQEQEFLRGYGFQGGASREGWDRGLWAPGLGAELKQRLRKPGAWRMSFGGFGECLPRYENYVDLDPERVDDWGIPLLRIHHVWSDNEDAIRDDIRQTATELLEAAGGRDIRAYDRKSPPGLCIHEMGTARMGRDPKTSVLNAWCQSHDVPNLFVTDGAAMASSACQNP
ncbi:MAG: GMC family oxidoreductase, partial [Acidobacteriota bacterium]|nr:GMC family oxidoreductase [Acidobacteriota bacterium]